MTVHSHSDRLIRSSRRNPCPVCQRVRDADCAFSPDRARVIWVICHHPRTDLIARVSQVGEYTFWGNTRDHRAAVFLLDEFERRQW